MSIEESFARIACALERLAGSAETLINAAAGGKFAQSAAPGDQHTDQPAPAKQPEPVSTVGALPQQAPPPGAKPRGRPRKDTIPEQTPPAAPVVAPATAPAAAAVTPAAPVASPTPAPSVLGELSEKIQELANTPGKLQVAIDILKKRHGAARVSELKPEEYPEVLAEVKAALPPPKGLTPTSLI